MITYKCPDCKRVYFWNGKGERPGNCTQRLGLGPGGMRTCGGKLTKQHEFEDVKTTQRRTV